MGSSSQRSARRWVSKTWTRQNLRVVRSETRQRSTEDIPRLIDWAAEKFPELERFDYLRPYAEAFEEAARGNPQKLAFAAPPQHGKTLFTLIALLWLATFYPGLRHAYVTYNQTRAEEVAKDFQTLAARVGLELGGTLEKMSLPGGTTLKFTSVKGGITGTPIDGVCVIDDPIKGAKEANSPTARADAIRWFKSEARTRRHPNTSYIAMATRWHALDLSGWLIKEQEFRYLNLKCIAEPANDNDLDAEGRVISDPLRRLPGQSLSPLKPPSFFKDERADLITWYAMYQGEPRPVGGEVFRSPTFYRLKALPTHGFKAAFGVDLCYSKKTSSDYSVCIEVIAVRDPHLRDYKTADNKPGPEDKVGKPVIWFYVREVIRKQVDAPSFTLTLKAKKADNPSTRFYWYASGTEKGAGDFIKKAGIPLTILDPHGRDKLMRAQRTAQLWNLNRIMVPQLDDDERDDTSIDWAVIFNDEVTTFTGVSDVHDDMVDALVAAVDMLEKQFANGDGPGITTVSLSDR